MSILSELTIHPCLRARTHPAVRVRSKTCEHDASWLAKNSPRVTALNENVSGTVGGVGGGFVLYLPLVCLRADQNPAFALACRVANRLGMPLVVLAVVLDDASHARPDRPHRCPPVESDASSADAPSSSVVMTSRRLAFTLQALSHACELWSAHGAAVGIRIHAGNARHANNDQKRWHRKLVGARTPDHLTLASRASFVVMDEPFVSPFTTMVQRVEEACKRSNVECVRVDGSCTVPPLQVLKKRNTINNDNMIKYDGLPAKAYLWQSKTERLRESHLRAAMEGHFDAPELDVKMEDEDLFASVAKHKDETSTEGEAANDALIGQRLSHLFPSRWKPSLSYDECDNSFSSSIPTAPDMRPFTSSELSQLYDNDVPILKDQQKDDKQLTATTNERIPFANFALNWPGADPTVPPCPQIVGTTAHGMQRWNNFAQNGGILRYGKERNDARLVHSPSRMSAYLNHGIVSIFRLVDEVKQAQRSFQTKSSSGKLARNSRLNKSGPDKFEEEIVKWREYSYAHAFSREDYDEVSTVPRWSTSCLNDYSNGRRYSLEQLANGKTGDAKWNAMQQYLVRTGELHNNVRMTWGKTVVEWAGCLANTPAGDNNNPCSSPAQLTLRALCYINDRYALDGLSPPSYAGLLWCMGWTDKPLSGSGWVISKKPAHRYRMGPEDFRMAEQRLLEDLPPVCRGGVSDGGGICGSGMKRPRSVLDMMKMQSSSATSAGSADSKTDIDDSQRNSSAKGMKRNGSFTIDRFFSKDTKKRPKK